VTASEGAAPRAAGAGLEARIADWRSHVRRRPSSDEPSLEALESRLRSETAELLAAGLDEDEAFLVAVKRVGAVDRWTLAFARAHAERLWNRLVVATEGGTGRGAGADALVALGLAVAAGAAIKAPELFGLSWEGPEQGQMFFLRNLGLFVLPFLAGFFAWKRAMRGVLLLWLATPFVAGALATNLMPFAPEGDTEVLAILHLPIALWLAVGCAHAGGAWRSRDERMAYVRFSGEWFIYYVLIALGGGVLMGTTGFVFSAIGLDADEVVLSWVLPCGAMGAVIIAAWLVGAKQGVVESLAPMLTLLFTPLFTLLLLAFLTAMAWTGSGLDVDRDLLIGFDLLLVLVVGLILYAISARDPHAAPGFFDGLQLVLVVCALLVDAMALWAILSRISTFGFTPNRVAALGENLILVANLGGSAVLYAGFLTGRGPFASLERWQTAYLPVYAAWAWIVVLAFPLMFGFR
jgi:hypothetical protein